MDMQRNFFIICAAIFIGIAFFVWISNHPDITSENLSIQTKETNQAVENIQHTNTNTTLPTNIQEHPDSRIPLTNASDRVTKKPFGIYITPATSPVKLEKFSGHHTGTDFEILPGEEDMNVEVRAICDGVVRMKQRVSGYGGVFIQSCAIDSQEVTVLYGHFALGSISLKVEDSVKAGNAIGFLGAPYSQDTDGERKHLHLGIHKGDTISYRGYVSTESDLSDWMNAEPLL
ncbi:MAG: hypothetical protein COT25_03305 [Candidatus Kerfeldbacteria bacterium CG08_land_8_20_14_0_20_42_7]|uniref:M23ase beta-sheet core domain-containing protein n=1 Tax=Candidatus Kerfeldbacteria bacterium CG08_land_8_20_14_0_20_42_7 TaxID=2014245 RepID=A0A2H0YSB7_9BACT|nr:MAG: hypothetical protein COT25_03305 [Candidatus Kerfeldbacteria bacterium CG08_land_8_20_14_0_20_42_7]